ncbi:MAG: heme exporter protein CcmB [Armatimonadetes bacterium]|nr:heme exporter protein CcmB [Armatimonadota bacterium]
MSFGWAAETGAVFRKEVLGELRGRHGLFTSLLFSVMTVAALGMASARTAPEPTLAAGMLWIALLFAAITGLARTFILEEEQGTGDLLRLWAKPGPVFWGKLLYNFVLVLFVAVLVVPLFSLFVGIRPVNLPLALAGVVTGSAGLAAAISVCGAFVSRSSSRGALAGVISIPVLLPVIFLGVGAMRIAFGDAGTSGWISVAGLAGIAMAFFALGPYLFAAVWN